MNSVIYLWRIPTLGVSEIPSFTVIVRFLKKGTYEIYCKILLGVLPVNLGQKPSESMESHILPRNTPIKLIELFLMKIVACRGHPCSTINIQRCSPNSKRYREHVNKFPSDKNKRTRCRNKGGV